MSTFTIFYCCLVFDSCHFGWRRRWMVVVVCIDGLPFVSLVLRSSFLSTFIIIYNKYLSHFHTISTEAHTWEKMNRSAQLKPVGWLKSSGNISIYVFESRCIFLRWNNIILILANKSFDWRVVHKLQLLPLPLLLLLFSSFFCFFFLAFFSFFCSGTKEQTKIMQ